MSIIAPMWSWQEFVERAGAPDTIPRGSGLGSAPARECSGNAIREPRITEPYQEHSGRTNT